MLTMKTPQYLDFKIGNSTMKSKNSDVEQFSPIPITRSPLMQQYQKKMERVIPEPSQSFQNMSTPGWSSLVQQQKSTKRTTRQEIFKKLIQEPKQTSRQKSPKYSDQNKGKIVNSVSYAKLKTPPPGMYLASQLTQRSKQLKTQKTSKTQRGYESSRKLSRKQQQSSRFKQISVHDHLYLDSKRQQAKKMMQKLVDQQFKKNIMSFQPKISNYTQLLAQKRFKKLKDDPDYRCSRKKIQKIKSSVKVQNPDEVQYRNLHIFFSEITGGEEVLSRDTLSVESIPLPCLRSIEPILQQVFIGAVLTWNSFLDLFYSKSLNRKTFFELLKQREKRQQRDITRSRVSSNYQPH